MVHERDPSDAPVDCYMFGEFGQKLLKNFLVVHFLVPFVRVGACFLRCQSVRAVSATLGSTLSSSSSRTALDSSTHWTERLTAVSSIADTARQLRRLHSHHSFNDVAS